MQAKHFSLFFFNLPIQFIHFKVIYSSTLPKCIGSFVPSLSCTFKKFTVCKTIHPPLAIFLFFFTNKNVVFYVFKCLDMSRGILYTSKDQLINFLYSKLKLKKFWCRSQQQLTIYTLGHNPSPVISFTYGLVCDFLFL